MPGDNVNRLEWTANEEWDLQSYRVYREPFWDDCSYVEVEPMVEGEYLDQAAVNGEEYTYWLRAVDHVGNESEYTAGITVETGIVETVIDPIRE